MALCARQVKRNMAIAAAAFNAGEKKNRGWVECAQVGARVPSACRARMSRVDW